MIVPSDSDPVSVLDLEAVTDSALITNDKAPEVLVRTSQPDQYQTRATVDRLQAEMDRHLHRLRVKDAARFRARRDATMFEPSDTDIDQAADALGDAA